MFFIGKIQTSIYFDGGKKDSYCVYIEPTGKSRYAPPDEVYFQWILDLTDKYSVNKVWNDFNKIYNIVEKNADYKISEQLIYDIDTTYDEDTIVWWMVFYLTMVAEENYKTSYGEPTKLGKRIKRLGVYNILFDKMDIDYVTQYMKHKHWTILDNYMKERGI